MTTSSHYDVQQLIDSCAATARDLASVDSRLSAAKADNEAAAARVEEVANAPKR